MEGLHGTGCHKLQETHRLSKEIQSPQLPWGFPTPVPLHELHGVYRSPRLPDTLKIVTLVSHGHQQKTSNDVGTETQFSARALSNAQRPHVQAQEHLKQSQGSIGKVLAAQA